MRNTIVLFINGKRCELSAEQAFMTVSDYLRYSRGLSGTKVVCAEGDCGACTILVSRMDNGKLGGYQSVNSCISFMYLLDSCHLISVEGLKRGEQLHPVQTAMVKAHGAQCGYCTPGFICAMTSLVEDAKKEKFSLEPKRVQNYLTGNLCRCTGYDAIIEAGSVIKLAEVPELSSLYDDRSIEKELARYAAQSVLVQDGAREAFLPATLAEALDFKHKNQTVKMTSGATDLGVLSNKGKLKLIKTLTLNQISDLYETREEAAYLVVGAKTSLSQVERASKNLFPAFSNYLHIFASPQIKNSGTLVGNVVNASPIADTIPFLKVAEAEVVLASSAGARTLNVNEFFKAGYKQLDLKPDELVTHIRIPKTATSFKLYKVSTRKDLDISTVTVAIRYELDGQKLKSFSLALGGVGPSVLRMDQLEKKAMGKNFDQQLFKSLAQDLKALITPLSDVRGSADYRHLLCQNLLLKFCDEVMREQGFTMAEISL